MQCSSVLALALSPLLAASLASAQTLVKDFNTTPSTEVASSAAAVVATLPTGQGLMVASIPGQGSELWTTDRTASGTQLLVEVEPGYQGSSPRQFVQLPSGLVMFTATTSAHGWELWKTDGTVAGTSLVKDIWPGSEGSVAVGLTAVGNSVAFLANDGTHGIEPWISDGTTAGTMLVQDVNPSGSMSNGTATVAALGTNEFVFTAILGGGWELWKSDGTASGTRMITSMLGNLPFGPTYLKSFGNGVLFTARDASNNEARWYTDGTAAGTYTLGAQGYGDFQVVGSTAYFTGPDNELWATDGTAAGTALVFDFTPTPGQFATGRPAFLGAIGSNVIFSASTSLTVRSLYRSDGTAAGTVQIGNVAHYAYYAADFADTIGGELYFQGQDATGTGTWRTDGTAAGTSLVTTVEGDAFVEINGTILFRGFDAATGSEPWTTDGTPGGTQLLVDLAQTSGTQGSGVRPLVGFRDEVVLLANDGITGQELWLTDGTTAGTRPITDIGPGAGGIFVGSVASNDEFLFFSPDGIGPSNDPWVSDGTLGGAQRLIMSAQYPGFREGPGSAFGDKMLFAGTTDAEGTELWVTDGTVAGTRPVVNFGPGTDGGSPSYFHTWRDRSYFLAYSPATGPEPWVTDGTAAGTFRLTETAPGSAGMANVFFQEAGDRLYFYSGVAFGAEAEMWSTDGTPAGTVFHDLEPGSSSSFPHDLTDVNGKLACAATIGGTSRLVVSDGTLAGTQALPQPLDVLQIARIDDDTALVIAEDGDAEIAWTTDGTAAGTQPLGALDIGNAFFTNPTNLSDDKLVIALNDAAVGRELFVVDGTSQGTQLLFDLALGNSDPRQPFRAGERVVYVADDGIHGFELFGFDLSLLGDETFETFGYGCAGSGGHVPTIDVQGEADASGGAAFQIVVDDALATTPVVLAWSRSSAALPLSGCTLWTGGLVNFEFGSTDGSGRAAFAFLPQPSLAGQRFVSQAFPFDPAGPVFGIASSTPGLELVFGP